MVTKKSAKKDIEQQATSLWKTPLFKWGFIAFLAIAVLFTVYSLFLGGEEVPAVSDDVSTVTVPEVEEVAPDSI